MVVKTEKAGYTVIGSKPGEKMELDSPYVMAELPEGNPTMQQIWQEAAKYRVEAHGEELCNLIRRTEVICHIPPFDMEPTALARILSGENTNWRIFRVKIMEGVERFNFSLVLEAGTTGKRYQIAEMGLDFGKLSDMAIKIIREGDGSYEVAYKRATDETGTQRIALAMLVGTTDGCQGIDIEAL